LLLPSGFKRRLAPLHRIHPAAHDHFGRLDVVVDNAGHGVF
jgi:hypothetical protein